MFRQKPLLNRLLSISSKNNRAETADFINQIVRNAHSFSMDDIVKACLAGIENPVKKLFRLAKQFPQLEPALPTINDKDSKGNTLLFTLLLHCCDRMKKYVTEVNAITNDSECRMIPFMFANQLYQLQKICRIIQYLINKNAHETATAKQLFTILKRLSESEHPHGKKYFIPLKNIYTQINECRNKNKYPAIDCCTFFSMPIKIRNVTSLTEHKVFSSRHL